MFKVITLPENRWREIIALIEVSPVETDHVLAELIREQLSGAVKVKATSKTVEFKAPKGGDLRGFLGIPK